MKHTKHFITLFLLIAFNLNLANVSVAETIPNSQQINTNKEHGNYVRKRFLQVMKTPFDNIDDSKIKILIIGDSHAQDFLNSIAENKLLSNSQIRTRYIPTRCQIYLGIESNRNWNKDDLDLCEKSDSLELAKSQIANADVIIMAAMWRKWAVIQLPQTLKNLNISSKQSIYIIGRRSFLNVSKEKIQGLSDQKLRMIRNKVDIHQLDINNLMSRTLDKSMFINVHKLICGSGSSCPVFTDRLKKISLDGGHLSQDGARYIGNILFEKSQLSNLMKTN